MTKTSKIALGLLSFPLIGVTLFIASFHVGSRVAAAPMEKIRASIKVGMSQAEVQALMRKVDDVTDPSGSEDVIQITQVSRNFTSPMVGSWLCFFHVQMGAAGVESIDNVSCVD